MSGIYVKPRRPVMLHECDFYHTMELPKHGLVKGDWDLRDTVGQYLGDEVFFGKRVLEIGTASGFCCFYMEKLGAEVVAYDLSEDYGWDIIPYEGIDYKMLALYKKGHIRKLNNSFCLAHHAYQSKAKVVYGNVYEIPEEIGLVDIVVYGSILLHVRDPFLALERGTRLAREKVIIVDMSPAGDDTSPHMEFLPDFRTQKPLDTWWRLSPEVVQQFIGILGFEESTVRFGLYKYQGKLQKLYTIVGHRTIQLEP